MGEARPAPDTVRLVVFDLDGTITYHDTLVPYVLGYLRRRPWKLLRLLGVVPDLLAFMVRLASHGRVKAALIRAALRGSTRSELQAWTDRFVQGLLARGVRSGALEAIEEHRRAGDILVLLSASPDLYVPVIAQRLGFAQAICTGVRWIGERLDGELVTPNRRGDEKTRCLEALRRQHPGIATVAYANGPADLDHLELCDHRLLVNGTLWTRRRAVRRGIPCAHWR